MENEIVLYNREGKYGQTCVVALENGALLSTGTQQVICRTCSENVNWSSWTLKPHFGKSNCVKNWFCN